MPYDPKTGKFTEEKTSVAQGVSDLISKDNLYMQQAATRGRQDANRRGLLNSSIAVQGAEAARINAALPIAAQDSAQLHERNIQGRNIEFQDIGQQRQIGANREFLNTEIASREKMQGLDIGSQERMQGLDLASRQSLQSADLAAAQQRLEAELGSRANLQAGQLAAERENLGLQLSQQERLALEELRAAEARLGLELDSREYMQGLDIQLQDRIANMNIAANERNAVAQIAQAFESTYSQTVSAIMSNPDIPATERQGYLDHAAAIRDSNLNLVEQFYGIELEWQSGGSFTPAPQPGYFPAANYR